ncbi:LysR family transcriptional regulator [Herbaspirillum sp.]|uniref:LysR family transcriptional regulator n=1 Tax=Herbaspirillum sp. TaxID=1890675 RepID=UPI001B273141|nr:LysR family transcriptional regulator [Herbaspirillum sp.]MBO9537359.1 LysR family transcriptional regulator [Herbaspirillum sp.]
MSFNLQQLEMFSAIVSAGSLGRAAAVLDLTQPALSRAIKRLEESVGGALFERHTRGMHLTPLGQALLPHAVSLQREARQAREELDAIRGLAKGVIKVGAVGSIASLVLPLAVRGVLDKWPNLRVEVIEGVWDRLVEGLLTHEIDLALSTSGAETDGVAAISDCRWNDLSYVVAGRDHPLRERGKISLADTLTQRWALTPKGTGPYLHVKETFAQAGLPMPEIAVESRSVTVLKSLVARCGFVGWMSGPMFDTERKAGVIDALAVDGLHAPRTLTAFRRRQGILPAPASRLLDELRHLTGSLQGNYP